MGPSERYSLLIESRTSGESEIVKLERAVNKLLEQSASARKEMESTSKAAQQLAVDVGLVVAAGKALQETVQVTLALGRAYSEARGRVGVLVDAYRGVRLAVSAAAGETALFFTGATIGATVLAEKLLGVANAYSRVMENSALASARGIGSFQSVQTFTTASAISGRDLSFLNRFDPDQARNYLRELEKIPDPINRANRATELFGTDASKVYELLGTGVSKQIEQAQQLTAELDGPTRASVQKLRDTFKAFEDYDPIGAITEKIRLLREEARQGITIKIAAIIEKVESLGKTLPNPGDSAGAGVEGGVAFDNGDRPGLNGDLSSPTDFTNDAVSRLKSRISELVPDPPNAGELTARASRYRLGEEGSKGSLEFAVSMLGVERARLKRQLESEFLQDSTTHEILGRLKRIEDEEREFTRRIAGIDNARENADRLAEMERARSGGDDPISALIRKQASERKAMLDKGMSRRQMSEAEELFRGDLRSTFDEYALGKRFVPITSYERKTRAMTEGQGKQSLGFDLGFAAPFSFDKDGRVFAANGDFRAFESEIDKFNSPADKADAYKKRVELEAEADRRRTEQRDRKDRLQLDNQIRMINLIAGPGGELAAVKQITALRISAAKTEEERMDAMLDGWEKVAEFRKKMVAENRETAGRIYEAMLQGPAGLRTLALGTLGTTGRTAFQNLSQEFQTSLSGKISLPGQENKDGSLNLFGRLLKGTPFGIDQNKQALDANTMATIMNTQAIMGGGAPGMTAGGAGVPAILQRLGVPAGVFKGSGSNPLIFSNTTPGYDVNDAGELVTYKGPQTYGMQSAFKPAYDVDAEGNLVAINQGSNKALRGVGIAGAAAGGAFGLAAGIKQGGLRGAMTGTSALAGAASSILMLSGAAGPAAPILAGVALGAMMVSSFLPDPKKQRGEAIDRTLSSASYTSPAAMNYAMTTNGEGYDYNRFGALRPIIINQRFDNMDAKSIIDRRTDISEAMRLAIQEAHPVNDEIRGLVSA